MTVPKLFPFAVGVFKVPEVIVVVPTTSWVPGSCSILTGALVTARLLRLSTGSVRLSMNLRSSGVSRVVAYTLSKINAPLSAARLLKFQTAPS